MSSHYEKAGVNIAAGNELVTRIKHIVAKTQTPQVLTSIGGFAALYELPTEQYKNPVLASATDGVGTKLKLAISLKQHDTIGIDLVAMCVNDLIVCGAKPLFFLDYYASGALDLNVAETIIQSIARGCQLANIALVGGETAEMPGLYQADDYDLAGFSVGIVDKANIIDGHQVKPGDRLLGLASSGPHSNGYSLIRHVLNQHQVAFDTLIEDKPLGEILLTPTRIYVSAILDLIANVEVHALAHITGGGLLENIPRVLPQHCQAILEWGSWLVPAIFTWLQSLGQIPQQTMLQTFNCGVGMVICVAKEQVTQVKALLSAQGETVFEIGHISAQEQASPQVVIQ